MWTASFNLIVLTIAVRVGIVVISKYIFSCSITDLDNRLDYALVSRKDLAKASDSQFVRWCFKLLERNSFTSVDLVSTLIRKNVQICGYAGPKKVYVKCLKADLKSDSKHEDDYENVGRPDIQKLVGTMEHDGVYEGWFITNGNFSSEAISYASTLPEDYKINLIDGAELTRLHRLSQRQYLTVENF
jgi:hypothetical protein